MELNAARLNNPQGKVRLGIIVENPDGSGVVAARLDGEEFIEDVIHVLGFESYREMRESISKNY
jgi:hypothetical protein